LTRSALADTRRAAGGLPGTIAAIQTGEAMAVVKVTQDGGQVITSSITRETVQDLGLAEGSKVTVLIKPILVRNCHGPGG
jgi:molybdate transport system regulatory protein